MSNGGFYNASDFLYAVPFKILFDSDLFVVENIGKAVTSCLLGHLIPEMRVFSAYVPPTPYKKFSDFCQSVINNANMVSCGLVR
jgi:hypothetical protein